MKHEDTQLKLREHQWRNEEFYNPFAFRSLDGELEIGVRAPNPGRGKYFLFCATSSSTLGQGHLPDNGYRGLSPYGYNGQGKNLFTHFSLRPKISINGALPSLSILLLIVELNFKERDVYVSNLLATFRNNTAVPSSRYLAVQVFLGCWTLEDGTDRLSQNVGKNH
jgi:hypothetical protein